MEKIVYFGCGKAYEDAKDRIAYWENMMGIHSYGIMDNNSNLWGTMIDSYKVLQPQKISGCEYYVITTPKYYEELRQQLIQSGGVDEDKIIFFEDFFRKRYAKIQYEKRHNKKMTNSFDADKIIVYTCITGMYDDLKSPEYISDDIEYICFTNNPFLKSDVWKLVQLEQDFGLDNIHLARYVKFFPNIFLKRNCTSVWVDAKYAIKKDLREYIKMYGGNKKILCFPHPERDCIYDEGPACIKYRGVNAEDMNKQLSVYRESGYAEHQGLYDTGCMVREHNDEKIISLMKMWWEQLMKYTYRDQISFPYICQKSGMMPDICDLDINSNPWLKVYKHK